MKLWQWESYNHKWRLAYPQPCTELSEINQLQWISDFRIENPADFFMFAKRKPTKRNPWIVKNN